MDYDFSIRNKETLELENIILKQIIIELKSDWLAPKFDHIWKQQIDFYLEDKED